MPFLLRHGITEAMFMGMEPTLRYEWVGLYYRSRRALDQEAAFATMRERRPSFLQRLQYRLWGKVRALREPLLDASIVN